MTGDTGDESTDRETGRRRYLDRRQFMMATGALAGVGVLSGNVGGRTTQDEGDLESEYPGLRIISEEPENAEAAARATYESYITPREEHYIRNHYPTPDIDPEEWTVSLTGMVDEEVEVSVDEIRRDYSTETVTHTMQCSGNGRSYFDPQVGGNQWTFGAVGNTVWTGTPVGEVLEAYGADTQEGTWLSVMGGEAPEGEDIFTRSIPMEKVLEDCLLAYEMNGSPMNDDHGYPVRLLVPGWYGNNNVKWVDRMHVMDRMVFGEEWETEDQRLYTHWQQYSYRLTPIDEETEQFERIDAFDVRDQMESSDIRHPYVYDQLVKSLIGYPGAGATVEPGPGGSVEVIGVAWAGDDEVDAIEVSTDGGDSWSEAEFFGPVDAPYSWRQFRYVWDAEPGSHTLYSRATDANGRTQPATVSDPDAQLVSIEDDQFPWNQGGYCNNAYEPHGVEVTVEAAGDGEAETETAATTTSS
ncbi:sulfite oxidase [Halorussus marinus]|uniref:sulfite oxidase n=1 Tax=Halorussus marinus TaxID=2505976 RepID=UPI001092B247|nr:sulfite oxidase [Halorussus marinus]